MKRKLLKTFYGDYNHTDKMAKIYLVKHTHDEQKDYYEVDFYTFHFSMDTKIKNLVETRQMITDGVIHSERYAEDAAINWVEGVIE